MQWDDSPYAGFSDVEPWIEVNENYHQINAASQLPTRIPCSIIIRS